MAGVLRHDVAIIGGGPAGIATALALTRAGRRVAVIERTRYDGVRIGETLPPRARPLLAGDAAMTWDPLSGQGICKALESGMHAARAIDCALNGDNHGLNDYAQWTRTQFDGYLQSRAKYYRTEQRWPDAPFWRRRHLAS